MFNKSMSQRPLRILGIDPGSRFTGYGVLDIFNNELSLVDMGFWALSQKSFAQKIKLFMAKVRSVDNSTESFRSGCGKNLFG